MERSPMSALTWKALIRSHTAIRSITVYGSIKRRFLDMSTRQCICVYLIVVLQEWVGERRNNCIFFYLCIPMATPSEECTPSIHMALTPSSRLSQLTLDSTQPNDSPRTRYFACQPAEDFATKWERTFSTEHQHHPNLSMVLDSDKICFEHRQQVLLVCLYSRVYVCENGQFIYPAYIDKSRKIYD